MVSHFHRRSANKMVRKIGELFFLLWFSLPAMGATIVSNAVTGNWSAGASWVGGIVPGASDDVIIADGATITIDGNYSCNNLQVGQGSSGTLVGGAFSFTVNGNLSVSAGGTFNFGQATVVVAGTTIVSGTISDNNNTGSATFTGLVTINAGGSFSTANTSAFTFAGGIINNGTFNKTGTGAVTLNNPQTLTSSGVSAMVLGGNVTVNGNLTLAGTVGISFPNNVTLAAGVVLTNTNTSTVTITGVLNGSDVSSQWVNEVNSSLVYNNAAQPMATGALVASANPNTVTYSLNGAQIIAPATYHNLVVSTGNTKTLGGNVTVNNNLTIGVGTTLQLSSYNITVSGTTDISGTLNDNNATGINLFAGQVTINPGATWTTTNNPSFTFQGGLVNNGTMTATGTGTYTFSSNSQDIGGSAAITFAGPVLISGAITVTNKNTNVITINGTLDGDNASATWKNDNGSTLNYGNASMPFATAGVLDASATSNTVNYYVNAAQTVRAGTYNNLTISGGNTKTLAGDVTVLNNLNITAGTLNLGNAATALTVHGNATVAGTLAWGATIPQTVTINGDLSGAGTLNMSGGSLLHTLNLGGANNSIGTFTTAAVASTVNYTRNGNQSLFTSNNYRALTLSGSGTKTLQNNITVANDIVVSSGAILDLNGKTLTSSGNITVNSGGELNILSTAASSAQLLIANGKTLSNSGVVRLIGQTGFPAILSRNAAGTYFVTQSSAGAVFHANNYQINYTNGGVVISAGSIDATNNFSNGSFSNGTGSQYLLLTGIDLTGLPPVTNVVFNAGPTYNVTRTSGTGAITFYDASGALAGESYDNDNGNPGTLILWSYPSSTYYSKSGSSFKAGDLSMWNSDPGGAGSSPSSVTDGQKTLIIQSGHTVTVESTAGDIDVLQLQIQNGGTLIIGNDASQRIVTVRSNLVVENGALIQVGSSGSPAHLIKVYGDISNDGTINLKTTPANVADAELYGATASVYGSGIITFNNLTFKTGTNVTALTGITVAGNVNLETGSVFNDGNVTHTVSGNWNPAGTAQRTGTGTIVFNGIVNQIFAGTAATTFHHITCNGGGSVVIQGAMQVNGDATFTNNTAVTAGNVAVAFNGNLTVNNGASYTHTANTTTFGGTNAQDIFNNGGSVSFNVVTFSNGGASAKTLTGDFVANNTMTISNGATVDGPANIRINAGGIRVDGTCNLSGQINMYGGNITTGNVSNAMTLGTAQLNIYGNVGITVTGPATACNVTVNNNVTVNAGYLLLNNNTTLSGQPANTFTTAGGTNLYIRGANNFPAGFGDYSLSSTSTTRYDAAMSQTVRGNLSYGNLLIDGAGSTKTVDGPLDINGWLQLNNATTLDLQNYTHTLAGDLNNGTNSSINGPAAILILDAPDANQTIGSSGTGSYSLKDLVFTLDGPTANRTKTINVPTNLNLYGDFKASVTGGSAGAQLIVNVNTVTLGGTPQNINIGAWCQLYTSHASFSTSFMDLFTGTKTFDVFSTVYYALNGAQSIADGFTYGNLGMNNGNKTAEGPLDINGNVYSNGAVFYDAGFTHTVAGDWRLATAQYTAASATGTIVLDGMNQYIDNANPSIFRHLVIAGSGTVTANNNVTVLGNLQINIGSTFDGNIRTINVGGNWTELGNGTFTQTTGTVSFNGTAIQSISQSASSAFANVTIANTGAAGADTVKALTDLQINGGLTITQDAGVFSIQGKRLYLGDNLNVYPNANNASTFITTGSTVYLNGNGATNQIIANRDDIPLEFNHLELTGSKTKVFGYSNTSNLFRINGNLTISGATLRADGTWGTAPNIDVYGDWTNTGTFIHTQTTTFRGGNQNISSSTFNNVVFAGTNTKTLQGNITVNGSLTINTGATLDANNYNISVSGTWNNSAAGAVFVPGTATVTLTGNSSSISTGTSSGPAPGKSFYNVVINKNAGQTATLLGDLDVWNDLTISTGTLTTGTYDIWVGGNFVNAATFNASNNNHTLTLNATGGTKNFDPGTGTTFRGLTINANATYKVLNDFAITNVNFSLQNGYFDLSGRTMTVNSNNLQIVITGGTFDVDSGTIMFTGANQVLLNNGGTLRIVGTPSRSALITKSGGTYTISQTAGTIHARYYRIDQTSGNGLTISGTSVIDAVNNFSDGAFTAGAGTAYLTLTGYNFSDFTASNVVFSSGPTYNVSRTSGTGTITFADASGNLAGENFDNDNGNPGTLINWTYPNGFYWDGEAGTDDWNDFLNWSSNEVPHDSVYVYLDHRFVAGAYTVRIKNANAVAGRLSIDPAGGAAVGLTLSNGYDLTVKGNVTIASGGTLTATDNTNLITVWGNWTNGGTYNNGSSTLVFGGPAGSYTINAGGAGVGKKFYNLTINGADGSSYALASAADIDNDLTVSKGTFDLGGAANNITVGGNWNIDLVNGGLFNPRTATVTFDGGNQNITNGTFYNFVTAGTGTKTVNSNLSVTNDVTIGAGTTLNLQENTLLVGRHWTNNGSFLSTGMGTVNFNGTVAQNIDAGTNATTFNHLVMSNAGAKTFGKNSNVNGDFTINAGSGIVNVNTYTVTGTPSGTFTIAGATTLQIRGANNFPANFGTYSLAPASTVWYYADADPQYIHVDPAWSYGNLIVQDISGAPSTKIVEAGTLVVTGTFTIADNKTYVDFATNSSNMTLTGDLNQTSAANQINWGTGTSTLTHVGNYWNINPNITGFNHLVLAGSGNKFMRGNLNITGNVTVKTGVTLRMYPDNNPAAPVTMTGQATRTFTMESGSALMCATPSATAPAFPQGFGTYALDAASTVYLNSPAGVNQTLYTGNNIAYGNLYFRNNKTVTSDGIAALRVNGSLDLDVSTYVDNGKDIKVAGPNIWLNNYTPSSSAIGFYLDGNINQYVRDANNTDLIFGTVYCQGTGQKNFGDGNDNITINGNFDNQAGITVTSTNNCPWTFNGTTWNNNGIFMQTGNTITFNNNNPVTINAGPSDPLNYFNNVTFSGTGTKTFVSNGADINGTFTINAGTVDMGNFDYTIAGSIVNTTGGVLNSSGAGITLDGGNQSVNTPAFAVNNITIAGTGTKRMFSDWTINGNLVINAGATLNTSDAVIPTYYNISIKGNWTNNGTFTVNTSKVTFNGTSSPVTIAAGASAFYDVDFIPGGTVTYQLTSPSTRISRAMLVGNNATLHLNSQTLLLGSNIAAGKTYTVQGKLVVNQNAFLKFNNQGSQPVMNVSGRLEVVGTDAVNIAAITREVSGTPAANATAINILAGATIAARYYLIEYLQDAGLVCQPGSVLDPVNNFSDGTWSNIRAAAGVCYLNLESDYTGDTIRNITFNFSGTPIQGSNFNVRRNSASPDIVFSNVYGNLGTYQFEDDEEATPSATTGKLRWPGITQTNWTGAVNTDWHNPGNWDNGVPTAMLDAIVPSRPNQAHIMNGDAVCKNLIITTGTVILENNNNLTTTGDITIGTAANVGILAVSTPASTIYCGGMWTRGTNGVFVHGGGTVVFNSSAGSVTITPLTSSFNNVTFNNVNTTFYLSGATINILGDFQILAGTVTPVTNNYTYNIGGNINFQGTFTPTAGAVVNGTVVLNGSSDQQITNGVFYNLTVGGSGNKITSGATTINGATVINSTLKATAGSSIDFNGDVTINAGGTFDDGNQTHYFTGANWTGTGNYVGGGTVIFDRTASDVNLWSGTFNHLILQCTGRYVYHRGNITVNGNFTINGLPGTIGFSSSALITSSGTGTMTMDAGAYYYCNGANNFPATFALYNIDAASRVYYQNNIDQTVAGVSYGNLYLSNKTKTLAGDIVVKGSLYLNNAVTLDVSSNNYSITLAGNWTGQAASATVFIPRQGEVIFNGAGNQTVTFDDLATNPFYNVTINKAGGSVQTTSNHPYVIQNNLVITSGTFDPWGSVIYIGGDLNNTGGSIVTSGTLNFNKSSGATASIRTNNATLNNVVINSTSNAVYTLQDNMTVINNFTLTQGTFDGNGKTVTLGDGATDAVTIDGIYKVGAGGRLALGNGTSLTVNAGGTIEVVGTSGNLATVTRNASGGNYNFQVNGNIAARYCMFEYMSAGGIYLTATATIDNVNNFSYATFTNGANNGVLLRVENTQSFTAPNYITDASFPVVPGGSSFNVRKISSSSGTLEFWNATGLFAGESFDDDPNNLIIWTGPVTLTWNGSQGTDWYNPNNWTPSAGPPIVPTGNENVIIAAAVNQPVITVPGARTASLTINNGATLIVNTAAASDTDLVVGGDFTINGTFRLNTTNDNIQVAGSWLKGATGTVVLNGDVTFNGTLGGSKIINNGSTSFYNLIISGSNLYQLGANTTVRNNVIIETGASFDLSAVPYNLTVGKGFTNAGTFYARTGKVIFNATSGPVTINPGSSHFYDVDINASGVKYILGGTMAVDRNLNIIAGELDLNGNILNMGDNAGADVLTVSGTLTVGGGSSLRMGSNASLQVTSGGVFKLVGADASNRAVLTRQSAGTYGVTIASGGTLWARYYSVDYINSNGVLMQSGAVLNSSNNLSDGVFSNGTAGGRYIWLQNEFGGNITISNVVFNAGPTYNVTRNVGTNQVIMQDASGAIGTYANEQDVSGIQDPNLGLILWTYLNTYIWTGAVNTDWHTGGNWSSGVVPDLTKNAIIPNVTNKPVISSGPATAKSITVNTGSSLTISNQNLTVAEAVFYSGTITATGSPVITLGDNWTSSGGTFNPGNSKVVMNATSGNKTIAAGTSSFYDLEINSAATYALAATTTIQRNFSIVSGTLNSNGFDLNVGGSWTNNGTFIQGTLTVTFNGTSGTYTINNGGGAFYNLTFSGGATYQFANHVTIQNNYTQSAGTVDMSNDGGTTSYNMTLTGTFSQTGGTFNARAAQIQVGNHFSITGSGIWNCGTSTLLMTASGGTKNIAPRTNALYNLTLNGPATFRLQNNLVLNKDLTITNGTLDVVTPSSFNITLAGDWTNNGTFLPQNGTVTFNGVNQTISRAAGETFYRLTTASSGTLTLASGNVTVNNTLTMTSGNINTGSNILVLGTGAANPGTLAYSSGTIIGKFERWLNATGTGYLFPVGTATNNNSLTITCVAGLTAGSLRVELVSGDPGSNGLPLSENGLLINQQFTDGWWNAVAANGLACTNYNIALNATGFSSYPIDAETRVMKRTGGGAWILEGTHVAASAPYCYRNGFNGLSTLGTQFGLGRGNCLPLSITSDPSNSAVCAGQNTSFTITASGTSLSYQWQENQGSGWNNLSNGGVYSNVTTSSLGLTNVLPGMNMYQYRCIVTDACLQKDTSNAAVLTVNESPSVTGDPSDASVCEGGNTLFSVVAAGSGLLYQWQENQGSGWNNLSNGGVYANVTTASLTLSGVLPGMNNYRYRCVVSGTCTPADTSGSATLTVNLLPAITTHPLDTALCVGCNVSFSVTATGTGISYQWQESINGGASWSDISNGGIYGGATTSTLTLTGLLQSMDGYRYRCVVTGTCNPPAVSNEAVLTVYPLPGTNQLQHIQNNY